ncbi:MAG: Phage polymerase-related protein [Patescibacteria group bacterium]|nr:Phage polymerase-related protein [Patescibacteria group bacterium]
MTRSEQLLQLHEKCNAECECKLKETATRPVFGDGNPDTKIVFIGEAPGKKEDETGVPFVGAAGKFLAEMLASIGMKREDIYITNIVKYRPPNNRDPEEHEKKECAAWLHEELGFIKPDVIIFLGRHSMTHFLPELKISEAHGKLVHRKIPNFPTEWFFPLYHPAAALYNGGMRETLMMDFKKIPKVLEKIQESKK